MAIGKLPTIISQPIRASDFSVELVVGRFVIWRNQAEIICLISLRKKIKTANSVPIWVIAVKRAPGSSAVPKRAPAMRI